MLGDVAAYRPGPQLRGGAAGDQRPGQVEVAGAQRHGRVVRSASGGPLPAVAQQGDRWQRGGTVPEPGREPVPDGAQAGGVLAARATERPAQVLLVDDHVAQRPDPVGPHPLPQRLGHRLPLGDQRGQVVVAALLHLALGPGRVVVVRLVPADHVDAQAHHVREQVPDPPVRAGRHPHLGLLRRQPFHQLDHPSLGAGPLRNAVHGAHLTGAGARDATVVLAVGPAQLPDRVRSTVADLCRAGPPGLASDRMRAAG